MTLDPFPAAPAALRPVLFVCRDVARVAELRGLLDGRPPCVAPIVVDGAMAALRHVLAAPVRFAIVDWALDGSGGQALVRLLARLRPELHVVAFDLLGVHDTDGQVLAWPWSELAAVLDRRLPLAGMPGRDPAPEQDA